MSFDAHQLHRPGTVVAGYTVLDVLGSSYPGTEVYHAKKAARSARLKVITTDDACFRQRCTEAWDSFGRVEHANILTAREMIEDRQLMFATDYVSATSLARCLARGAHRSEDFVVHIVSNIASALDAGISEGLRHLNLKPTNVLLGESRNGPPHIYVTDFGMARHSWKHVPLEIGEVPPADLLFIPPECLVASPHERSDVYSLGMIAYVLLGGWSGNVDPDPGLMLWAYANETAPLILNFDDFADDVADVLASAAARSPSDRPASGSEFSLRLASALHVEQDQTTAIRVSEIVTGETGTTVVAHEDRPVSVLEIAAIIIVTALVSCICTVILLRASGLA